MKQRGVLEPPAPRGASFPEQFFTAQRDHFNPLDSLTWPQRYWTNMDK